MIRLGSLAGYPFEGPRCSRMDSARRRRRSMPIVYKPEPDDPRPTRSSTSTTATTSRPERFPFNHPRAAVLDQAGRRPLEALDLHVRGAGRAPVAPRADRPRAHRHLPPGLQPAISTTTRGKTSGSASTARPRPARSPRAATPPPVSHDGLAPAPLRRPDRGGDVALPGVRVHRRVAHDWPRRNPLHRRPAQSARRESDGERPAAVPQGPHARGASRVLPLRDPTKDGPTSRTRSRCSCPTSTRTSPTLGGKALRSSPNRVTNRGDSATTKRSTSKGAVLELQPNSGSGAVADGVVEAGSAGSRCGYGRRALRVSGRRLIRRAGDDALGHPVEQRQTRPR